MKASELLSHLDGYLRTNEDCEVKLFCESVVYDDIFDENQCEVISDIRSVNDWPLPGESIVIAGAEQPAKYLVIFYDSSDENKQASYKRSFGYTAGMSL
jgi:hypothetical protein